MEKQYWNGYYSKIEKRSLPNFPSQFATFVASEAFGDNPFIIDVGCGNGRDSHFFSHYGFRVVGIDSSERAIARCEERRAKDCKAVFMCADLADPLLAGHIIEIVGGAPVLLYARFFLHAVDEHEEEKFFKLAKSICGNDGKIAVEFRTDKDEALSKVTDAHYRRFIDPLKFLERSFLGGFTPAYYSQGFGYAKFRDDDAHVARLIMVPTANSAR